MPDFIEKDTVDLDAIPTKGFIYNNGPWSMCVEDIISDISSGGSPLSQWIPSRGVNTRNEHIAHLSWIAPEGFTGATSYVDYLASLDPIDVCDYGPTADWNAIEYTQSSYGMSFQSKVMTYRDTGLLDCERSPIYKLRGANAGFPLDNEGDWAMAQAAYLLENHMNWNLIHGDPSAVQQTFEGLDVVIDTGYVSSHAIGPGDATFTDPTIVNGTGLSTPTALLRMIKGIVRKIRQRGADRGVVIGPQDMCIAMPRAHWGYIADAIAWGSLVGDPVAIATKDIVMNNDVRGYFDEKKRITQGFFGSGFIEIDNQPVPVIVDDVMGANGTDGSDSVVTGDIYILTRRFAGMNILEQQYTDFNKFRLPAGVTMPNVEIHQNGLIRAGWKIVNSSCFQYFVETEGRLVSRFQPLQAKITDVSVTTILENENESTSFASQDFYAFGGGRGGQGNTYLLGLGVA